MSAPSVRPSSTTLPVADRRELIECERIIGQNLKAVFEVGRALSKIRDSRLYRETHPSFDAYCKDRWNLCGGHAIRQISASKAADDVRGVAAVDPSSEGQVRPLVVLHEPDERKAAWQEAVEVANGQPPTSGQVKEAVDKRRGPLAGRRETKTVAEIVEDARAAGIDLDSATVTVAYPDETPDAEPEAEPEPPRELTDDEWLATLPARSKLAGLIRERFDGQALYYRHTEAMRRDFKASVARVRAKVRCQEGPYVAKELWYFRINHPAHWIACESCDGNGVHKILGQVCPACKGSGYHVHDGGK